MSEIGGDAQRRTAWRKRSTAGDKWAVKQKRRGIAAAGMSDGTAPTRNTRWQTRRGDSRDALQRWRNINISALAALYHHLRGAAGALSAAALYRRWNINTALPSDRQTRAWRVKIAATARRWRRRSRENEIIASKRKHQASENNGDKKASAWRRQRARRGVAQDVKIGNRTRAALTCAHHALAFTAPLARTAVPLALLGACAGENQAA